MNDEKNFDSICLLKLPKLYDVICTSTKRKQDKYDSYSAVIFRWYGWWRWNSRWKEKKVPDDGRSSVAPWICPIRSHNELRTVSRRCSIQFIFGSAYLRKSNRSWDPSWLVPFRYSVDPGNVLNIGLQTTDPSHQRSSRSIQLTHKSTTAATNIVKLYLRVAFRSILSRYFQPLLIEEDAQFSYSEKRRESWLHCQWGWCTDKPLNYTPFQMCEILLSLKHRLQFKTDFCIITRI